MSKLSRDDILKLAHLSRLKLTEDEIQRFRHELSEILDYVEMLNRANVDGLDPTYQVTGLKNVLRQDVSRDYQAKPDSLLKNAPNLGKNQFKVRRVL